MSSLRTLATLPTHPRTGLRAVGVLPSGRVVWPILGGSEPAPEAPPTPPQPAPPTPAPAPPSQPTPQPDKGSQDGFPANTPVAEMTPEQQAAYWRHQSRKHEERAKAAPAPDELAALREKANKHDELENSLKTDQQRLQDERDAATARANEQAAELARLRAATKTGLPADLIEFVTATDEAGAEEQARKLLERLQPTGGDGTANGTGAGAAPPKPPTFDQGARGRGAKQEGSVQAGRELYEQRHKK